jgi:arginine decarboxylase
MSRVSLKVTLVRTANARYNPAMNDHMDRSVTESFTVGDAAEIYGLDHWGGGYFNVASTGHLQVSPDRDPGRGVDIYRVVQDLARRGLKTPLLLRFPQLVEAQVKKLTGAFGAAIAEYEYPETFTPVFPIKVNQQMRVNQSLLHSGQDCGLGFEVGSRPELLAATSLPITGESLVICNGFKDQEYFSLASLATRMGKRVVVVIEKPFEIEALLQQIDNLDHVPLLGFRLRLRARGSGFWEKSGGFASKFGLTTQQLLDSLERLKDAGLAERVVLLHFHIGSQITEIRKIKAAIIEASRVYSKLHKMGCKMSYLDVGGGLGVDYDGSKTSSDASVNYGVQEYANDVVFGIKEVCEQESVPPPKIVCESGRMLVAYHSMLITDVRAVIPGFDPQPPGLKGDEHQVVADLAEVSRTITVKNYREFYHDALEYRSQMDSLFSLGMLELADRARAEALFWRIAARAVSYAKTAKFIADEFVELNDKLVDKYLCNFSVFQSLPDHWALDQLFPVVPIHRLDEQPSRRATLVDITCDSDGEVDKFVDLKDLKQALEVHPLIEGEPYYLAFMLVGAYQDTMGDMHNLFGRVHEAEVVLDSNGQTELRNLRSGEHSEGALTYFGWEREQMMQSVEASLQQRADEGRLTSGEVRQMLAEYHERLSLYPYLD